MRTVSYPARPVDRSCTADGDCVREALVHTSPRRQVCVWRGRGILVPVKQGSLYVVLVLFALLASGCLADRSAAPSTRGPTSASQSANDTATASPSAGSEASPSPIATITSTAVVPRTPSGSCAGEGPDLRIVTKEQGLPPDCRPPDLQGIDDRWAVPGFAGQSLRKDTAAALVRLLSAASAAGLQLRVRSTFRSYEEQASTFQYWVGRLGEAQARRESALAGHSEHQLGTTADLASPAVGWELITEFGDTAEGKWLAAHAHEYGFAFSYPRDTEAVTGYMYEPWHIRFIGQTNAAEWKTSGLVLVRFLQARTSVR